MSMEDRRRSDRRTADRRKLLRRRPRLTVPGVPVRLLRGADGGRAVLTGLLLDISPSGVRLTVEGTVEVGESLLIEARLADAGVLNLAARVAWSQPAEDRSTIGCRLSAMPPGEKLAELRRLAAGHE